MWWAETKRRPVGYWLSQRCVAKRSGGGPLEVVVTDSVDQGITQLREWLSSSGDRHPCLWLGGALCQLIAIPAMKGVATLVEAQAIANLELASSGAIPQGFEFKLHECDARRPVWRGTLTNERLAKPDDTAWQRKLASMKPWWAWALARRDADQNGVSRTQTILAFDGEALTELGKDAAGRVKLARTQSMSGGADALRRQMLRRQAVADGDMEGLMGVAIQLNAEPSGNPAAAADAFPFSLWTKVVS